MIIPSIDLMDGQAVQLVQGQRKVLDAGDPRPLAERFGRVGEVAVIDLDAALGRGDNRELIEELLSLARCRVGGGIRSVERAREWLELGAERVILGTAATPEVLRELPRERVIAAVDARDGEVVVEGWTKGSGDTVLDRMQRLRPFVGGFLLTFVESEGMLGGLDAEKVRPFRDAAGDCVLTVAGGVSTAQEIAVLDALGVDAQVGMALYTGRITLAKAFAAPLHSDRADGLWATVVCDETGRALGLAWSDAESLACAIEEGRGVYHSRRRGLWRKGESSGAEQELLAVDLDCDRDALRFRVRQSAPGFCHREEHNCWDDGRGVERLSRRLRARAREAPEGSYTARLLGDETLLRSKLREEATELAEARTRDEVIHEAADLIYFCSVALARADVELAEVESHLDARERRVYRRAGDAKPEPGDGPREEEAR